MALADAVVFLLTWFGLYELRASLADSGIVRTPINPVHTYVIAALVYLPFWIGIAWLFGLYSNSRRSTSINQLASVLRALGIGLTGSLAIAYLFKQWDIGRFILLLNAPILCGWFYVSRTALRHHQQRRYLQGVGTTRAIVIGIGRTGRRTAKRITEHGHRGYELVGYVDPHSRRKVNSKLLDFPVLGHVQQLQAIVHQHRIDEVFLAAPLLPHADILNLVTECEHLGVQFKIVGNLFDVISGMVQIDEIDEVPVVHLRNAALSPVQAAAKRAIDLLISAALLSAFLIPMLIIAAIIRLDSKGPAVFRQQRIGLRGRSFLMYKFRTMKTSTEPYAIAPSDAGDSRVTTVGYWLRKYSLDEFPQLINVLTGDMSMVGPRPEMPFLVGTYSAWERRRLDVKPGITGLWQIAGRKNLPLSLNMEYDFYYINNQSLLFDLIILIKTVPAVLLGRGAF